MKKVILILVVLAVAAGGGWFYLRCQAGKEIGPDAKVIIEAPITATPTKSVPAEFREIFEFQEAVGTIRPKTETSVEARVTAQVLDVKVSPGREVKKGDLLVALDQRQPRSRLDQARQGKNSALAQKEQARQAVAGAQAAFESAKTEYARIKTYFDSQAATARQLEQAKAAFLQAEAELKRAGQGMSAAEAMIRQSDEMVKEANIALTYTRIIASEDGVILKRLTEPGDLALPGKPLLVMRSKGGLRLEASVREGLAGKVRPGESFEAKVDTLGLTLSTVVDEVVPYADPVTRTFLVKASLPRMEGLYPGMYAKLRIPLKALKVVVVPKTAVIRVGQLEMVKVKEKDRWKRRYVKTGRTFDTQVEILSGLSGKEIVGIREGAS